MGSFFQSIHLRTEDVAGVEAAARLVARKECTKFLIAHPKGDWINIYSPVDNWHPHHAQAIAKASKAEHALAFYVHDSDVLHYWYFRRGVRRDQFVSCPDYFGKATKGAMDATGNPDAFHELLPDAASRKKLKEITSGRLINGEFVGDCPDFEDERLAELAALFGIVGVLGSYEGLNEGEKIKGVGSAKQMTHVG